MKNIRKLLSISSDATINGHNTRGVFEGTLWNTVIELLREKNGFYTFESALHVFPFGKQPGVVDIEQWNSPGLWRDTYGDISNELLFFAEDVFGGQFCFFQDGIGLFDPETGEVEHLAHSIEEWAGRILEEYEYLTGYPLAHEWQLKNGVIPQNHRLIPAKLFVLGGEYEIANLRLVESTWGMRARGPIAQQLRDLPDGSAVEFKIIE